MTSTAKIFLPKNRIESLVLRPGGIPRKMALERAVAAVEELRDGSIEGIWNGIESIEATIGASAGGRLTIKEMHAVLRLGVRITFLAETFGFSVLSNVTKLLCDLVGRLIEIADGDAEAIGVFVGALRLFAPRNSTLGVQDSDAMLRELSRVLFHYGVQSESACAISSSIPIGQASHNATDAERGAIEVR